MPLCMCDNPLCDIHFGYCHCGCGMRTNMSGRRPRKFCLYHNVRLRILTVEQMRAKWLCTAWTGYCVDGVPSPCWIWTGSLINGYGQVGGHTKANYAHVYFYTELKGPVPLERQLDHLCRVRRCCNPDHLDPVTPHENSLRGSATKITNEAYREIRVVLDSCRIERGRHFTDRALLVRALAAKFGVTRHTINNVVAGRVKARELEGQF